MTGEKASGAAEPDGASTGDCPRGEHTGAAAPDANRAGYETVDTSSLDGREGSMPDAAIDTTFNTVPISR